jgi:broad specificity phosphatase PhoE
MPVIHLVRHGQASVDAADYDVLSSLGELQARATGRALAQRGLRDQLVLSGTLNRQRDTAKALVEAADLTFVGEPDPRWDEYDHLHLLTRYSTPATVESVQDRVDHALTAWIDDPDGGWSAFQAGASQALHELPQRLGPGRDAVVVTSGGVIATVCGVLLGLPPTGVAALNRVTVNAGLTTFVCGGRGVSLLTFNDHAHLDRALLTYR